MILRDERRGRQEGGGRKCGEEGSRRKRRGEEMDVRREIDKVELEREEGKGGGWDFQLNHVFSQILTALSILRIYLFHFGIWCK